MTWPRRRRTSWHLSLEPGGSWEYHYLARITKPGRPRQCERCGVLLETARDMCPACETLITAWADDAIRSAKRGGHR